MPHASWPIASTSWVRVLSAITVGSLTMMPWPRAYTRVFAVPRSIARSLASSLPALLVLPVGFRSPESLYGHPPPALLIAAHGIGAWPRRSGARLRRDGASL